MALSVGDQVAFDGGEGTVVATTATTDPQGRGEITFGGTTFRFRVLKAPPKGDGTQFPYVANSDPHFRVGLVKRVLTPGPSPEGRGELFCLVFDDLPAPTGWGRWIQQEHWREADDLTGEDSVVFTLGWRPGTITIRKGGVAQSDVYADLVLRYSTSQGIHEAWWQPAYPYNDLEVNEGGVPLRGPNKLGPFRTDDDGVLWRCRPDGALEEIIFPRGLAALGNRESDRWPDGPEPERYLAQARVYYLQEWEEVSEGLEVTLDIAAGTLDISGPASAKYVVWWEGAQRRAGGTLSGAGTATVTGLVAGAYTVALFHSSDVTKELPRQDADLTAPGASATVTFPSSWNDHSGGSDLYGRVYLYGSVPAAGATVYYYRGTPPGWYLGATTGSDGSFTIPWPTGGVTQLRVIDPRGCAVTVNVSSPGQFWDPQIQWRIGACRAGTWPPNPSYVEGLLPWGTAGGHTNLTADADAGYLQNEATGERYAFKPSSAENGSASEPMPHTVLGLVGTAIPDSARQSYGLYDADGEFLSGGWQMWLSPTFPPWTPAPPPVPAWWQYLAEGRPIYGTVGGKVLGSVVEADRSSEITVATLPEAARLGLEFGKWTQPLDVRSVASGAEAPLPLTFTDWECPYCGGPVWCEPDGDYTRGHCMQCADYGVTTDCRSYFITRTLPALNGFLNRIGRIAADGGFGQVLISGWPRPEEYDESDDYLVPDWAGLGIPRWVAAHLVFAAWTDGLFTDGESIAEAESRLGRTVGPVQLKLVLTQAYQGSGQTLRIACTRWDGGSEWRTVTIPAGSNAGALFPLNWYPHASYPRGYCVDVTAMEKLAGDGAVYGIVVNDGPAWHSSVGVAVRHQQHSPYACDVSFGGREPFLVEDYTGRLHLVYLRSGQVLHRTLEGTCATWSEPVSITAQAGYCSPSLSPLPHGTLLATADTGGTTRLCRSEDDGERWE